MKEKEKSKADMMFMNLGYKKEKDEFFNYIEYIKKENKNTELVISFEENNKVVVPTMFIKGDVNTREMPIGMTELCAINEKVKELKWLDK